MSAPPLDWGLCALAIYEKLLTDLEAVATRMGDEAKFTKWVLAITQPVCGPVNGWGTRLLDLKAERWADARTWSCSRFAKLGLYERWCPLMVRYDALLGHVFPPMQEPPNAKLNESELIARALIEAAFKSIDNKFYIGAIDDMFSTWEKAAVHMGKAGFAEHIRSIVEGKSYLGERLLRFKALRDELAFIYAFEPAVFAQPGPHESWLPLMVRYDALLYDILKA